MSKKAGQQPPFVAGSREIYGEPIVMAAEWDVDSMVSRSKCILCPQFIASLVFTLGLALPCACHSCNAPCAAREIRDKYKATHLLLTNHNLIYKVDKHYGRCPSECCIIGAEETIVQLGNISDVETTTVAGYGKCCIDKCWPVTSIRIQTPGQGGPDAEIREIGIKNAQELKTAIMAARRGEFPNQKVALSANGVAPGSNPVTTELARLADLRARGLLSEQEFAVAKANLLGMSPPQQPMMGMGGPGGQYEQWAAQQAGYQGQGYYVQQPMMMMPPQQQPMMMMPPQQQQQQHEHTESTTTTTTAGGGTTSQPDVPRRYGM